MQQAQLYIEGQRIDMFEDVSLNITDTLKNVKDISKVFTEYSDTFTVPASKTNNKVFKHYYNSDIQNGFDARLRVTANIELNSIPFKNGYIKLEGVDLRDNKAYSYRITFFGNTVSLKNLLGEDLISSLPWLDNFSTEDNGDDLLFSAAFIEKYLKQSVNRTVDSVTYNSPIQVPLLTHTQKLSYNSHNSANEPSNVAYTQGTNHGVGWNQLKYAIKLNIIIKAIEKKYPGIVFSSDFFHGGDSSFDDLYMWLHRTKGIVTTGEQIETYLYSVNDFPDYLLYNGSTMENSALTLKDGYYFSNQYLVLTLQVSSSYVSVPYNVTVFRDGVTIFHSAGLTGSSFSTSINVSNNSEYKVQISANQEIGFTRIFWSYSYFDSDQQTFESEQYYSNAFTLQTVFDFNITQQVPKMKVLDFLTSIFKMFNLVAYIENGVVIVKDLDSFYANPSADSPYDITRYVDVSSKQRDAALPFKEIVYTYKGLGTFLAKQHEQIANKDWGKEEYSGSEGLILYGGTFKNEIPFEHMKFERLIDENTSEIKDVQYGYCVDDNKESYIGSPIIFYMALKGIPQADQRLSLVNDFTNGSPSDHTPLNSYYAPANSDLKYSQVEDRQSLNFSPEFDEWELTTTNETLFNNYHSNYISGVFNPENRITKLSAYLPLRILLKYTLADRFFISGDVYKINSIETDLYTGKSDLELLKDIAPVVIDNTPPSPVTNLSVAQGSVTGTSFQIQWTKPAGGVVFYNIDLQQAFYTTIGDVTSYVLTGLSGQTQYTVAIYALDSSGNTSAISNIITVNTQ